MRKLVKIRYGTKLIIGSCKCGFYKKSLKDLKFYSSPLPLTFPLPVSHLKSKHLTRG